jgi:hypothetical protein
MSDRMGWAIPSVKVGPEVEGSICTDSREAYIQHF